MLKTMINVAMVLLICLLVGYAKPLPECKSHKDSFNGCIEKEYYDDNRQKIEIEIPYKNGEVNGVVKTYYESGQLKRETPYKSDLIITHKEYNEHRAKQLLIFY